MRRTQFIAILFMLTFCASFSLMNVFIREVSEHLDTRVMVFWRNFLCVFLLLPFMLRSGLASFKTTRLRSHLVRSIIGIIGMETWFYCVATLPLNQATALSYTSPLFTTLFAAWYLKEHLTRARMLALLIGFLGAMIILRPDVSGFNFNALSVLFATSMWAIAGITIKSLTSTEPPLRIVFYMSVIMSIIAFFVALPHWQWPNPHQWLLLLVIAICSLGSQLSLAHAYKRAEVASLMPYDFARLIFTAFFAWVAFHESSDLTSWIGAAIIIASAAYITRHESRQAAKATIASLEP